MARLILLNGNHAFLAQLSWNVNDNLPIYEKRPRNGAALSYAKTIYTMNCICASHQIPIIFHHSGPMPRKQIRNRMEQMKPTFHHWPWEMYPEPKKMGDGPVA